MDDSDSIVSSSSLSSSLSDSERSHAPNSNSRHFMNVAANHDVLDFADEEQDEIFFFKCPMLVWHESRRKYVVSPAEDEVQGNDAI